MANNFPTPCTFQAPTVYPDRTTVPHYLPACAGGWADPNNTVCNVSIAPRAAVSTVIPFFWDFRAVKVAFEVDWVGSNAGLSGTQSLSAYYVSH